MSEANTGANTEAAKTRWKSQIERSLGNRNFAEAKILVEKALAEFADDPDFLSLEDQVTHARERSVEAYQLMEEGRQLCTEEKFEEGVQVLRSAYSLDERNPLARSTLIDNLLCYALAVLEADLPLAEKLAQEATALDPENPVNKSVAQSIQEYKQSSPAAPPAAPTPAKSVPAVEPKPAAAAPVTSSGTAAVSRPASPAAAPKPVVAAVKLPPSAPPSEALKSAALTGAAKQASAPLPSAISAKVVMPAAAEARTISGKVPAQAVPKPGTTPKDAAPTQAARPAAALPRTSAGRRWMLPAAAVVLVLCAVLAVQAMRRWNATSGPVAVAIRTTPAGAAVRINGQLYDVAQEISLPPGNYRIEALLDGYQPAVQDVTVSRDSGLVELNLLPVIPLLRISTDLASGSVSLDGQPAGELQNGQFVIESLAPGEHLLRVSSGRLAEALIPVTVPEAGPPALANPITAKELRVLLLGSFEGRGYVYSSFGPAPLRLDGMLVGRIEAGKPLQLAGLTAAPHELVFGEGREQRKLSFDVASGRSLFVSVSSDRNVGTLEIVSNEAGFELRINGKPTKASVQRGRYFVYNLDAKSAAIQVSKAGFDTDPQQQEVVIRKGETTRASFKLAPTPTTATLHLTGVLPGTRVSLDGSPHELQADGSLQTTVAPGEHTIELTRPGFKPKSVRLSARAGQSITLSGNDVVVSDATTGKLTITARSPANATILLRRGGTEIAVPAREAELPEGDYTLIATAAGYRDESRPVRIAEGTPATVDVRLAAIPQIVRMEGWDDPKGWRLEDGWYTRKGGAFILFKGSSSTGNIEFTARHKGRQLPIFRGGQIRWVVNYVDARNYDLYEMDGQKLSWKRFVDGKAGPQKQAPHGVKIQDDTYRLTVEVGSGQPVVKLFDGKAWKTLPPLAGNAANSRDGRFGFFLPNNEEMWLTDFEFHPTE